MGNCTRQILHIFLIFFFFSLLVLLNAAEYLHNVHQERENGAEERENQIQKVSGNDDEREGKSFPILEKFRVLLGINTFNSREIKSNGKFLDYMSPSLSPAPSPASLPPIHHHPHPHHHHHRRRKPPPPVGERGGGKVRVILVSAIVSGGATFILCAIVLIWGCQKFKKQRRSRTTTTNSSRSKFLGSQNLVRKVSFDPDPDHIYIDSLETVSELEPQRLNQEQEPQKDLIKSESGTVSSSNFGGISDESFHSADSFSDSLEISATPPPPPPPPPPMPLPISSTKIGHKVLGSARNLDSPSGSNQNPQSNFPPPSQPLGDRKFPPGIPPPPRPPPFSRGQPPPPLPPSQVAQISTLGKNGSPLPKLKPLHWDKVRAAPDGSMVWDKLRSSSFEFDEEMIESLFGYDMQNSVKNEDGKSKSPSPSKHVLEPKRLQNVTILAKALNATAEQVCEAILQGSGLSLQQLETLVKMEPTKEEETKLKSYKGDINELGSAEKFVLAIMKIPFAFLRIEAMLYKETFEDEVLHIKKSFSMLEEACKELRLSRLFLKLLEAVLKTGNRMNVGTTRGGARAFKLSTLLKLADVKGTDGKTTLLHFVVQEIARSEGLRASDSIIGKINQKAQINKPENKEDEHIKMGLDLVSGLCTELCNVKKTATIDLDVLASSIKNLKEEMVKLKHLLKKDLIVEEKSGGFLNSMKGFLNYVEKNLKELKEDETRVLLSVREITEYFHGDVGRDNEGNVLGIFVIVRDFLSMLDHVCRELRSTKIANNMNPLAPFS
ncbi:hypothetical protein LguiA_026451 [Lonicera macranthoides]